MRNDGHPDRCALSMSIMDCVVAMSEGNPGAVTVLCESIKKSPKIDPDAAFPIMVMLSLDTLGLYGSQIWILYKDICGSSMVNLCAILRADQLGHLAGISDTIICQAVDAIECNDREHVKIDIDKVLWEVQERLPKFTSLDPV